MIKGDVKVGVITVVQLFILICSCIFVSITDIKYGKIPNKILMITAILGSVCNIYIYGILYTDLIVPYIVNAGFLILFSIILYSTHTWAGGDTKLLILIAYMLPVNYYMGITSTYFSSWLLILFIFSIGYLYIAIDTIKLFKGHKFISGELFKKKFMVFAKQYIKSTIYLSAWGHLYTYFVYQYVKLNSVVYVSFCIVIMYILNRIELFRNKVLISVFLIFDILMTLFTGFLPISTSLSNYVIILFLILLQITVSEFNYKYIETNEVSEGMILSLQFSLLFRTAKTRNLPNISDETLKSRLTYVESESVKRWANSKNIDKIQIVRKIPFAICITLGLCCYVVLGGVLR